MLSLTAVVAAPAPTMSVVPAMAIHNFQGDMGASPCTSSYEGKVPSSGGTRIPQTNYLSELPLRTSKNPVQVKLVERLASEVRRTPLPRTPVNRWGVGGIDEKDDWRLMGLERYLRSTKLRWKPYYHWSGEYPHDYCEFCGARVCSGSVRHGVQADGREVVSFARPERPSHFVHLLPDIGLLFGSKRPKNG